MIESPRALLGRRAGGQVAGADEEHERAHRHVDEEDRAPGGAEDVGVYEKAGDDRTEHRRQAGDRAEDRPRLAHLVGREHVADQAEDLREHYRTEGALERT
jgi:hypothetical protein